METLYGKEVVEHIKKRINEKYSYIENIEKKPHLAVLGIKGNASSEIYIRRIEKNCKEYGIDFTLKISENSADFIKNFNIIKNDKNITGIMFQEPLTKELEELINEIPPEKDVEGVSIYNMGKLFLQTNHTIIPCTSKAVIEMLDYYKIDVSSKNVTIVGRSNIVGKPVMMQLLEKNATVQICHSKTKNLQEELSRADIIIMSIGKPQFLKKEYVKENAIVIDVGINYVNGKIIGDVDFENVKNKVKAISIVPGGIGAITNILLIENIFKSFEMQAKF